MDYSFSSGRKIDGFPLIYYLSSATFAHQTSASAQIFGSGNAMQEAPNTKNRFRYERQSL